MATNLTLIYYYRLSSALRGLAIFLFIGSVGLITAYGHFDNEFLRITVTISSLAFSYYAHLHWFVRWLCVALHLFIVVVVETSHLRELIMQLACMEIE